MTKNTLKHEHKCYRCRRWYTCTHKAAPEVLAQCALEKRSICDECFKEICDSQEPPPTEKKPRNYTKGEGKHQRGEGGKGDRVS